VAVAKKDIKITELPKPRSLKERNWV